MEASTPTPLCIDSPDPETTFALGALLGRAIGARGLVIGLIGPLGAGKTLFVKGLAEGLGLDPSVVSSPTFVIAQQYPLPDGPEALHHLDLYRLESEDELEGIGLRDWLAPGQVVAVEWLDRFPQALGEARLEVTFLPRTTGEAEDATSTAREAESEPDGSDPFASLPVGRRIRVTARGDEPARVLRDLAERWARRARGRAEAASGKAGAGRAGGAGDSKPILALLLAGWLGLEAWSGGAIAQPASRLQPDDATACRTLVPEPASSGGAGQRSMAVDGDADGSGDGLGPLRVRCIGEPRGGRPDGGLVQAPLEGMARLLDGGRVDPNDASLRLLESLPGIGPARAAAIDEARRRAPFRCLRDLEGVPGIGPKTRAKLEAWLAVDPETPPGC